MISKERTEKIKPEFTADFSMPITAYRLSVDTQEVKLFDHEGEVLFVAKLPFMAELEQLMNEIHS